MLDRVEHERGSRGLQVDRGERLQLAVHPHLSAAVLQHGLGDAVEKHLLRRGIGVAPQDDAAPLTTRSGRAEAVAVAADRVIVIRCELHLIVRRAEHLERGPAARYERRRTANIDNLRLQLEDGAFVDHHGHVFRNHELRPVGQRLAGECGADEVGRPPGIAEDADHLRRACDGNHGVVDSDEGKRRAAVAEPQRRRGIGGNGSLAQRDAAGHHVDRGDRGVDGDARPLDDHPDGQVGRIDSGSRERSVRDRRRATRSHFVYVDGIRRRGRLKPEVERAACDTVAIAVERCTRRVDDRVERCGGGHEPDPQLVGAIGTAAVAAVFNARIERRAGARDGHVVGVCLVVLVLRLEVDPDERVATVVVVVAGYDFPLTRSRILAIQHEHGVRKTRDRLARPGHDRLQGHPAVRGERERIKIDVRAIVRMQHGQMHEVVFARNHAFRRRLAAHVGRDVVGMTQTERMADFVGRDVVPGAAIFTLAPVQRTVHDDKPGATNAGRAIGREQRIDRADVTRHDHDAVVFGLDDPDTSPQAVVLENLPGPLFLRFGDGIDQQIALAVEAVIGPKVVPDDFCRRGVRQRRRRHVVRLQGNRHFAVPRFVDRAGLGGEEQRAERRRHSWSHVDAGSQRLAADAKHTQPGRRIEARVFITARQGDLGRRLRAATDLQAVQLVAQVAVERQRGPTDPLARAIGRRVGDRPGDPHRHFGPGVGIGLDQPVVAYRLRRGREQRVVGVEMHHDGVAGLRE